MWLCLTLALVLAGQRNLSAAETVVSIQDPARVLQAYLRATYARDFAEAYRFISSADRKVRDLDRYVQQRGSFNGFALEVARKLSEAIAVELAQLSGTYLLRCSLPEGVRQLSLTYDFRLLE